MSDERIQADVAFIEALADLLRRNDLGEIEVRREYGDNDSIDVRVSRSAPAPVAFAPAAPAATAVAPVAAQPTAPEAPDDPTRHPGCVTSPMVGTAYLCPEPGATPFVAIGTTVTEGQTLMIVEAMKTMNHIPAPRAGTVKRIMVSDGTPVEYGAPLMIVE